MASLLVLAPDIDEVEALLRGFVRKAVVCEEVQIGTLRCAFLPALDMLVAVGGNGKAQFGVQAQYLIDRSPGTKLLVCVGAAGRLADAMEIGDVVVATATVEYDYKNRFSPKPLPRHEADGNVLRQFIDVAGETAFPFQVHFGPIASGDEDIVDAGRAAEIRMATVALCTAWEGSGGARAARMSGIGFVEIRGITDAADGDAARSFHENVGLVMLNVVDLLLAWHAVGRAAC